jgi:ribosomal protein L21E
MVKKNKPVKKMAEGGMSKKQTAKVGKVMGEFKEGKLHSGKNGKVVKDKGQAIAIALSVARKKK